MTLFQKSGEGHQDFTLGELLGKTAKKTPEQFLGELLTDKADPLVNYRAQRGARELGDQMGGETSKQFSRAFQRALRESPLGFLGSALPVETIDRFAQAAIRGGSAFSGTVADVIGELPGAESMNGLAAFMRGWTESFRPEDTPHWLIGDIEQAVESAPGTALGVGGALLGGGPVGAAIGGAVGGMGVSYSRSKYQAETQVDEMIAFYEREGFEIPKHLTDDAIENMAMYMALIEGGIEGVGAGVSFGIGAGLAKLATKRASRKLARSAAEKFLGASVVKGAKGAGLFAGEAVLEGLEEVVTERAQAPLQIDPVQRDVTWTELGLAFRGGMVGGATMSTPMLAVGAIAEKKRQEAQEKALRELNQVLVEAAGPASRQVARYENEFDGKTEGEQQNRIERATEARMNLIGQREGFKSMTESELLETDADGVTNADKQHNLTRQITELQDAIEAMQVAKANLKDGIRTEVIEAQDPTEYIKQNGFKFVAEPSEKVGDAANRLRELGVDVRVVDTGKEGAAFYDPQTPTTIYLNDNASVTADSFAEGLHELDHLLDHLAPEQAAEIRDILTLTRRMEYAKEYTTGQGADTKQDRAARARQQAQSQLERGRGIKTDDEGIANLRGGETFSEVEGTASAVGRGAEILSPADKSRFARAIDAVAARVGFLGQEAKAAQRILDTIKSTLESLPTIKPGDQVEIRGKGAELIQRTRMLPEATPLRSRRTAETVSEASQARMDQPGGIGDVQALSSRAAADTSSPEFKQFFGKSQVVDEGGEPLVVYHGSTEYFDTFNYDKLGQQGTSEGRGLYFTSSEEVGVAYQTRGEDGPGVLFEGYLNIEKPLSEDSKTITKDELEQFIRAIDPDGSEYLTNYGDVSFDGYDSVVAKAVEAEYDFSENDVDLINAIMSAGVPDEMEFFRTLKSTLGYDGIITAWGDKEDGGVPIYIAFLPEQAKSVESKAFDTTKPSFLESRRKNNKAEVEQVLEAVPAKTAQTVLAKSDMVNWMTPEDALGFTRSDVANEAIAKYDEFVSDRRLLADALQILPAASEWYMLSEQVFSSLGEGRIPLWKLVAVIATTSAQKSVKSNVDVGLRTALAYTEFIEKGGDPSNTESLLRAIAGKNASRGPKGRMKKILSTGTGPLYLYADVLGTADVLQSQTMDEVVQRLITPGSMIKQQLDLDKGTGAARKLAAFLRNLMGDDRLVTNDVWMAFWWGVDQQNFSSGSGYAAATAAMRNIASAVGMSPAQGQAAAWAIARVYLGRVRNEKKRAPANRRKFTDVIAEPVTIEDLLGTDIGSLLVLPTLPSGGKEVANEAPDLLRSLGFNPDAARDIVGDFEQRYREAYSGVDFSLPGSLGPRRSSRLVRRFEQADIDRNIKKNVKRAEEGKPPLPTTRLASRQGVFDSKMYRSLNDARDQPNIKTSEQLRAFLGKQGVEREEIYWTGLDEFLKSQDPKATVDIDEAIAHGTTPVEVFTNVQTDSEILDRDPDDLYGKPDAYTRVGEFVEYTSYLPPGHGPATNLVLSLNPSDERLTRDEGGLPVYDFENKKMVEVEDQEADNRKKGFSGSQHSFSGVPRGSIITHVRATDQRYKIDNTEEPNTFNLAEVQSDWASGLMQLPSHFSGTKEVVTPFVFSKRKGKVVPLWQKLALKRSLAYAVENGYEYISLPNTDLVNSSPGIEVEGKGYDALVKMFETLLDPYIRKGDISGWYEGVVEPDELGMAPAGSMNVEELREQYVRDNLSDFMESAIESETYNWENEIYELDVDDKFQFPKDWANQVAKAHASPGYNQTRAVIEQIDYSAAQVWSYLTQWQSSDNLPDNDTGRYQDRPVPFIEEQEGLPGIPKMNHGVYREEQGQLGLSGEEIEVYVIRTSEGEKIGEAPSFQAAHKLLAQIQIDTIREYSNDMLNSFEILQVAPDNAIDSRMPVFIGSLSSDALEASGLLESDMIEERAREDLDHVMDSMDEFDESNETGMREDARATVYKLGDKNEPGTLANVIQEELDTVGMPLFSRRGGLGGEEVVASPDPRTSTPEFQRFYEGTHPYLYDEQGEPLVLYHGTMADPKDPDTGADMEGEFDRFVINRGIIGNKYGPGVYATASPDMASNYAGASQPSWARHQGDLNDVSEQARILPLYFALKRPYVIETFSGESEIDPDRDLRSEGYDGVIRMGRWSGQDYVKEAVAFEPGQVKSALGNRGTFDRSQDSMLESRSYRRDAEDEFFSDRKGQRGNREMRKSFRAGYAYSNEEAKMIREEEREAQNDRLREKVANERVLAADKLIRLKNRFDRFKERETNRRLVERMKGRTREQRLKLVQEANKERQKEKDNLAKSIRKSALEVVRLLPEKYKGKIAAQLAKTDNPKKLAALSRRAIRLSAHATYGNTRTRFGKAKKMLRKRKMSNQTKKNVMAALDQAENALRPDGSLLTTTAKTEQSLAASEAANKLIDQALDAYRMERDDFRSQKDARSERLLDAAIAIEEGFTGRRFAKRKQKGVTSSPFREGVVRAIIRMGGDMESLIETIDESGVFSEYLVARMRRAESDYYTVRREIMEELDLAAQRAGFASGDALLAATSDSHLGIESTQKRDIIVNGKKVTVRLGELMKLAALDDESLNMILDTTDDDGNEVRGVGIAFRDAGDDVAYQMTADEYAAILATLTPEEAALVQELKDAREKLRDPAFDVFYQLHGYQPRFVPGYEPRSRRATASMEPPDVQTSGVGASFLDTGGFTKERVEGGGSPVLIGDFLSDWMNSTDALARLSTMAMPVRDAYALLMDERLSKEIVTRYGQGALDRLREMFITGSGLQPRAKREGIAKLFSDLAGALSVAYLSLNPGTFTRVAAGGVARMISDPDMPIGGLSKALVTPTSWPKFDDIAEISGYFYARNREAAIDRRTNQQMQTLEGERRRMAIEHLKAAMRETAAGRIGIARKQLINAFGQIGILDLIDRTLVRVAVAAHMGDGVSLEQAVDRAETTIRRTQNTTSALDDPAILGAGGTGSVARMFLPFASDPMKAGARLHQAAGSGDMSGVGRWVGSTLANATVNVTTRPITYIIGYAISEMFGDEEESLVNQARIYEQWSADTMGIDAISETIGSAGGVGGYIIAGPIADMVMRYASGKTIYADSATPQPLGIDAIAQFAQTATYALQSTKPETRNRHLKALANQALKVGIGDPTQAIRKSLGALDPIDTGEVDRAIRLLKKLKKSGDESDRLDELIRRLEAVKGD